MTKSMPDYHPLLLHSPTLNVSLRRQDSDSSAKVSSVGSPGITYPKKSFFLVNQQPPSPSYHSQQQPYDPKTEYEKVQRKVRVCTAAVQWPTN